MEESLERMEKMLATLIGMVDDIKKDQLEMKQDIAEVKVGQKVMREDISSMQNEHEKQHNEMMNRLVSIEIDKELTWEKVVQNERELLRLKKQFDIKDFT